jgi:hypothetical protein
MGKLIVGKRNRLALPGAALFQWVWILSMPSATACNSASRAARTRIACRTQQLAAAKGREAL